MTARFSGKIGLRSSAPLNFRNVNLFTPLELFSVGQQGVWYDPSDFSTMFQDAAGTTPVTAVEQPVGCILDKRVMLDVAGPELVTNGEFTSNTSGWTDDSISSSVSSGVAVITNSSNGFGSIYQSFAVTSGKMYLCTARIRAGTSFIALRLESTLYGANYATRTVNSTSFVDVTAFVVATSSTLIVRFNLNNVISNNAYIERVSVKQMTGNHATQSSLGSRPVLSARYNLLLNTDTLATQTATTVATSYTLRFTGTGSITLSGTATGTYSAGTHTITTTAGTLTLTVSGSVTNADLRVANDGVGLPVYQRVNTSTDYDSVGFPPYLRFDGSDDSLATATINPGAVDKAQVFAGVRKLSDGSRGCVVEFGNLGTPTNGSFFINAPLVASYKDYTFSSGGTSARNAEYINAAVVAPTTNVLSGVGDISGDSSILRVNGSQVAQNTGDQGTGNYTSQNLFIGRRAGTSLPFNGRLYGLIVRFSSTNLSAIEIDAAEKWVNSKTRAY